MGEVISYTPFVCPEHLRSLAVSDIVSLFTTRKKNAKLFAIFNISPIKNSFLRWKFYRPEISVP